MASNHRLQVKNYGKDQFIGSCACRQKSKPSEVRTDVEDWHRAHMVVVERARKALGAKEPSLEKQRDYYREMEKNSRGTEKALWKQLADEIEHRLGGASPTEGMDPLF